MLLWLRHLFSCGEALPCSSEWLKTLPCPIIVPIGPEPVPTGPDGPRIVPTRSPFRSPWYRINGNGGPGTSKGTGRPTCKKNRGFPVKLMKLRILSKIS